VALLGLGVVGAVFTSTTAGPPSVLSAGALTGWEPSAATATRTATTTCLVSWTPRSNPPTGLTYDVTDGTGTTVATGVSGTSTSITVPAGQTTPTVKARLNNWVSSTAASASPPSYGYPSAPTALTLTPTDSQLAATWTAPAANGGTIASYAVTGTPTDATLATATCTATAPTTSCTLTGLTNGATYTVTVTATSNIGTGPAATATAIPYPSTLMSGSTLKLWLDGADTATLYASSTCSGATATSSVGCWKDKSTSVNHVSQATGSLQPGTTSVNGRAVPLFDGTDDYLAGDPTLLPTGTASSTVAAAGAVNPAVAMNGISLVSWGGTTSGTQRRLTSWSAIGVDAWTTPQAFATAWPASQAQGVAVGEFAAGTSVSVWGRGDAGATGSGAYTTGTHHLWVGTGGTSTPSGRWMGSSSEIIVFSGTLTAAQRRTVEEYLARKWLSIITPAAPTAVAAIAGDTTAAIAWTAPTWNGGAAITSYTATATPTAGTGYATAATATCSSAASPCTVTGLTNGLTYTVTVTAANSAGTGPASTSTTVIPRPALLVSTDAKAWLDGVDPDGDGSLEGSAENCDTATACTAASNVLTRWRDKSGNARDAVQSTSAMAATFTPATGLVSFSANGYYQVSSVPVGPDATTFAVASAAASTFNTSGWLVGSRSPNGWMLHPNSGGATLKWFGIKDTTSNDQTTNTASVSPTTAITNPHIWDGWISGTATQTLNLATDGDVGATVSNASARAAGSLTLTIGADDFDLAARRGNGSLREIATFDRALTDAERRTIREYLARKWAVTLTPQAPTGLTATAGDAQAGLSWTAPAWNGGAAVSSYTVTATPTAGTGYATASTQTCTSASTACTVTGLTNGLTYTVTVTAANTAGTGPASTSTTALPYPSTVMSGTAFKLWLDAATTSTLFTDSAGTSPASSGDGIGKWSDRSGNSMHATAPSGVGKPVLTSSAINGKAALRFVRTNPDYLQITQSGIGALGSADRTIVVVGSVRTTQDNSTNAYGHLIAWPGFHTGLSGVGYPSATALEAAGWTSGGTYVGATNTISWPAIVAHVGATSGGTLSVTAYGNAVSLGSGSASSASWRSYSDLVRIGAANVAPTTNYTDYLDGDIGEILGFNRALTSAERRGVEEYLARKWGVTITPQAPTSVSGTAGNAQVAVSWTAPGWNGGASVTGYTVTASPGGATCTSASTSCTVTGLTNGTAYTFTVTATSSTGTGPASAASSSVTPATTPGAPTGVAATAGDTTSAVSWTAPASNGGSAITSYTATATPTAGTGFASAPTRTCTASASPCSVTALTNGLTYTVTVTATNAIGTGTASTSTTAIPYPAGVMSSSALKLWLDGADSSTLWQSTGCTTTAVTAAGDPIACWKDKSTQANNFTQSTSGNRPAATSLNGFLVPLLDGTNDRLAGSATLLPNGSSTSTMFVAAKLTDPTPTSSSYRTVFEHGTTSNGQSRIIEKLNSSASVTAESYTNYLSDGTWGTATQVVGAQWASGVMSLWNSGRPTVTSTPTINTGTTFATVGSENGSYFWMGPIPEIIVLNTAPSAAQRRDIEEYLARKWSSTITPQAPTIGTATAGNAQATVSWTAPAWDGGGSVTGYTVTASPGGATCTGGSAATSCTVTGLTNGTAYTFTVTATNSAGIGPASAASNSVTPLTTPGAPTGVTGWPGDTAAWVAWGAPASNGGSAITSYTVSAVPSSGPTVTCSASASPCQLTGLTNSTAYTVTVTATSAAGTGSASSPVTITPRAAQSLYLWGAGAANSTTPVQTGSTGSQWRQVSTSGDADYTTCGVRIDGTLWCWGDNSNGQLGDGTTTDRTNPTQVGSGTTWAQADVGGNHTCAVRLDGTSWCWGLNDVGQLGDGTTTQRTTPTQVGSGTAWAVVAAGSDHSCALRYDGTAWCWGDNGNGRLGDGTTTERHSPTQVGSGTTWGTVQLGGDHSCATRSDGTVWCWGANANGQLGDGSTTDRSSPTQVGSATTWSTVRGGYRHTCGTRTDGTLWCWGLNSTGQLGDGTSTQRTSPVQVGSLTTWAGVDAGTDHTCAVRTSGTAWCWGSNVNGQLGDGTTTQRTAPVQVGTATMWTAITAGYKTSAALLTP
jgi:alpha-tubulin suppressor-like RCC1 family protein